MFGWCRYRWERRQAQETMERMRRLAERMEAAPLPDGMVEEGIEQVHAQGLVRPVRRVP